VTNTLTLSSRFVLATLLAAVGLYSFFWLVRWSPIYWLSESSMTRALAILVSIGVAMAALTYKARVRTFRPPVGRSYWIAYGALLACAAIITSLVALDNFPTSADEYAYLFQARTFEAGRLWNDPKPLGQALSVTYAWAIGNRWVGQYPPFWPAVLAVFDVITPSVRLANALTIAATGFAVAYVVQRRAGRSAAWLAAGLFALCPFTIFNGASLMSHPMAAALGLAALVASLLSVERRSLWWSAVAGVAIGLLGMTRFVSAPVFLIVVLLDIARAERRIARLIAFGLGGLPSAAVLAVYQKAITGSPLHPAYWISGRTDDHLYFDYHSIVSSVSHTIRYIVELHLWTSPFLLMLWIASIIYLFRLRTLRPIDLAFPLGIVLFCFYPLNAGIRFGPRYYFDFWPCAVITIGSALRTLPWRYRPIFRRGILLSMCFGLASTLIICVEWHRVSWDREEVYRLATTAKLQNAVLCMDKDSGTMLPLTDRDFPRNGFRDDAPVLYVRCARTISPMVNALPWKRRMAPISIDTAKAAYPSRSVWTYTRKDGSTHGELVLLSLPLTAGNKVGM